ncbi:unnamed protein product [Darwinula stevensoni]|uniref:Uncharacterized protein n=1 Tax=Darwinula stevensoni TaxID=69355 RepID=A0A7R8XHM0_9CRUS|nr:unnamed protein product [Darwinula stevensoni]CAG0892915.1 unnamed protein product [Darwinula stevensoni]
MIGLSTFLCISILSLALYANGNNDCPPDEDIRPCTCGSTDLLSETSVKVDCSFSTGEKMRSAFNEASWPSSQLAHFYLRDNEEVKELPDGVFGNISFKSIKLWKTAVETIHPSVILSSKDRLSYLTIGYSHLETFPFDLLQRLSHLEGLNLVMNLLTSLPALQSDSLRELKLLGNRISKVNEDGWATPNLRLLELDYNPISVFPSAVIKGLERLEEFTCVFCNLGPTLSSGLLEFHSSSLMKVLLGFNEISAVDAGSITGVMPDTTIILNFNDVVTLKEETFRPILEVLSRGNGFLNVTGYNL